MSVISFLLSIKVQLELLDSTVPSCLQTRKVMKKEVLLIVFLCVQRLPAQTLQEQCKNIVFEVLPKPGDTSAFIICINGNPEERSCPSATCFDSSEKTCSSTACSVAAPVDQQLAQQYCSSNNLINVAIPSMSCTHYYLCLGQLAPVYVQCPDKMHYSEYQHQCVSPPLAKCQAQEKLCEGDDSKIITYASDECYAYYKCENSKLISKTCAYAQKFDANSGQCVADMELSCAQKVLPDCSDPANANVYFPHENCAKFYVCSKNGLFEGQCASGFRFDTRSLSCKEDRFGVCDD